MDSIGTYRPTSATIDLDALAFNFHSVRNFAGTDTRFMAVIKADAYGHGAVECARRLEWEGVDWFAVATLEEGVELRLAGVTLPLLVLGGIWPGQETNFLDHQLTPIIFRLDQAKLYAAAARSRNVDAVVHVKIDTGMGRIGFRPEQIDEASDALRNIPGLIVDGLMTHFAAADELAELGFTIEQMKRFDECVEVFIAKGFEPTYVDMANSPGAVVVPGSRSNMVRIGGLLFGLGGDVIPAGVNQPVLKPVMSIGSRIASVKKIPAGETIGYGRTFTTERESLIAAIPIGYSDGFSRSLSNKGRVIVNGQFAPVAGRVSMDWLTVDVTDIDKAGPGSEVVIIGRQRDLSVTAEDIAHLSDTISYEVTCGISRRVPRRYRSDRAL